jgi:hypothetical protein
VDVLAAASVALSSHALASAPRRSMAARTSASVAGPAPAAFSAPRGAVSRGVLAASHDGAIPSEGIKSRTVAMGMRRITQPS